MFQIQISPSGRFGLVSDDRQLFDKITISAAAKLNEAEAAECPPLPLFDRSAQLEAELDVCRLKEDVDAAEKTRTEALTKGDFAKLTTADQTLETTQADLARAERLRATLTAALDQQEARDRQQHNANARDRRKQRLGELTKKFATDLADFLDVTGEDMTDLFVLHEQIQNLQERINNDGIAAIYEEAEEMRRHQKFWAEQPEVKADLRPSVETVDETVNNVGGTCSEADCGGDLCLVADGIHPPQVVCERCGTPVENHPILAEAV